MNKDFILSICIPTYNRAKELDQALYSILMSHHNSNLIEICISDNASEDNTYQIVNKFIEKGMNIKYSCSKNNEGADKNFLRVIEMSTAQYCWFLGSDDLVKSNSIKMILDLIDEKAFDIILFNRDEVSIDGQFLKSTRWFEAVGEFDLSKKNERYDYLNSVTALGGVFSYISSIVFRRKLWNSSESYNQFINTNYIHVAKLLDMIKNGAQLKSISESIVDCRINFGINTFHGSLGEYKRLYIDFYYLMITCQIFGFDSKEYELIFHILKKERNLKSLLSIKYKLNKEDSVSLYQLLKNSGFLKEYIIVMFFPKKVLSFLFFLKKLFF
ncbi:glycosyltransferase family 2 protein [Marinomonas sp. RSW2]|uniref:Glycosyltransferase family 2 protein n=1 Tax=Marinomonas maritima TaxID=2940935 RepID=A0ABT5W9W2_9GAMM|nr:glycosyltransferase family 2 protein [Marinomonas maritima]MDE8601618.1 glycosyltransferase family 2 protein [Marinomonas maritima]